MDSNLEKRRQVLDEQNPWHRLGAVPPALAPPTERPAAQLLWQRLVDDQPRRFHLVLGPRRVGKTTAMYQTARRLLEAGIEAHQLWWLRLDHPVLLRSQLGDIVRGVLDAGPAMVEEPLFLFMDELVYAEGWDLWLKTFYDDRWPVRIVASSSATAALRSGRAESGVGRWEEHLLLPYLLPEYLELADTGVPLAVGSTLEETIREAIVVPHDLTRLADERRRLLLTGGFPELIVSIDRGVEERSRTLISQQTLRADAVERAVYKDIPQSFGVDNPLALERVLYVLAGQIGGIVSASRLARAVGSLSQPTIDKYVGYLERAFLIFLLPNYSGTEAAIQRRGRKVYFRDPAVRNAALLRGIAPLDDPVELGRLYENLAASHLMALSELTGARLFHWRDRKHEVDLVYDHPDAPLAFEIGSSPDHPRSGLTAFAERHPRFAGRCWLVAPNVSALRPEQTRAGVGTLPLDLFLLAVGAQAGVANRRQLGDLT